MATERLRIAGQVQGVGYRWWVTRTARGLGLEGWVRNRLDGSVEVLAFGEPYALEALRRACRVGPRSARISGVRVMQSVEGDPNRLRGTGFATLATE